MNLLTILCLSSASIAQAIEVGATVPSVDLGAHMVTPAETALGDQVMLVNMWASWCAPCRAELPLLDALHDELSDSDAVVVGVNIDKRSQLGERVLDRLGLDLPVVWDPDAKLVSQYGPARMPTSYLVGADGKLLKVYEGELDAAGMSIVRADIAAAVAAGEAVATQ